MYEDYVIKDPDELVEHVIHTLARVAAGIDTNILTLDHLRDIATELRDAATEVEIAYFQTMIAAELEANDTIAKGQTSYVQPNI
jgi:hypothetical protein